MNKNVYYLKLLKSIRHFITQFSRLFIIQPREIYIKCFFNYYIIMMIVQLNVTLKLKSNEIFNFKYFKYGAIYM